ncbi:MAG: membrane dipeptidase [Alphaproteobacteria bacterium]|nr:membrane dipeptidase [Alphaproteobacteria bacterium]
MDRREFALGAGALLAGSAFGGAALAYDGAISSRARSVHRRAIVVDANLGPPLTSDQLPLAQATLDLARNAGVSAIKTSMGGFNGPFEDTLAEIAFYQRLIEAHPDYFRQIRNVGDIAAAKRARQVGIIFSFESATCLEDKVDRIDLFRNLGVRVMQLSYNTPSPFGAGVMSPPDATLTDLGRQAVARMNEKGVALDLSHANPATTAAAIAASTKPVLITHAGCAAVHNNPRNKSDEVMRAVAEKGGVFGIFDLFFTAPSPRQPNVDDYIAHMTHALDVCGEDHVGIGSDTSFDTMEMSAEERDGWNAETQRRIAAGVAAPEEDGRLPFTEGLNRPDRALVIADALLDRGIAPRVVEKVLGGNFVRAFGEIW